MILMRAFLLSWLCFANARLSLGMRRDDLEALTFDAGEQSVEEDPPQCPVSIASEHGGDPEKKWCCASGAKMFDRKSFKMPVPAGMSADGDGMMTIWMNNGCKVCADAEARFEVFNVEVHKFP